jgi:amidase
VGHRGGLVPTLHGGPDGALGAGCRPDACVISGPDPRSPLAISEPGEAFFRPLKRDFSGTRVAWSQHLGGLPVDPRVTAVLEGQRHAFDEIGCLVEDDEPDFSGADEIFKTLRAWHFELDYGGLLEEHRGRMKETVAWNIEQGRV